MNRLTATAAAASSARAATARSSGPSARGYRIRDFCEREGISRATCWRWVEKGVVVVSRLERSVGVRVVYAATLEIDD